MLNTDFFHREMPGRPMGKYAHIVMLRVTEGYAVFQTDGELNRARVAKGVDDPELMTRIALFKRKQTTPERLNGRELLRNYALMPDDCIYNENACKRCPDCITYGFAIGDGGSEKSKVYADTAFSLTDYAISHEVFTLNAPYEDGTMSDKGVVTSRINQQDHVKPQVIFPSVITTRDLSAALFAYVLGNVMRTTRYGATTTRGGTVHNHIAAIILSDGEIFSNLLFAQKLHDELHHDGIDPISVKDALSAAEQVIPALLDADNVRDHQRLMGAELATYLKTISDRDEAGVRADLTKAREETEAYFQAHIAKPEKKAKK
ncbi:MAG: type I-D CRISPR-associated protein Cas7/Csc2 [Anaerolineae bacterium]|nr:type I-D CRISPR-associated protein Cas7/Csc2 [Anaerolineae bacterium]